MNLNDALIPRVYSQLSKGHQEVSEDVCEENPRTPEIQSKIIWPNVLEIKLMLVMISTIENHSSVTVTFFGKSDVMFNSFSNFWDRLC